MVLNKNKILVYGCQKLLILFKNKKNIPWDPRIHTMKQNCVIFTNQLIHVWHEVIQNVSMVLNTHGKGERGSDRLMN